MIKEEITLPVHRDGKQIYDIKIHKDFAGLPECIGCLGDLSGSRICVVTDSNVSRLYAQEVLELLQPVCRETFLYTLPAGEEHKGLEEISGIYAYLLENHLDRRDVLVALGGGVVGDMTGFTAATYLRGIRWIQVPTTLLAMCDSSIGGKTGVDFAGYKNMVGAFYMPNLVYIAVNALQTLPEEQFASGMGEVLKHGLIRDASYYEQVIGNLYEIAERDPEVMMKMVEGSCRIKREIVEKDPTEKGERMLLNFGHTIGHAIETCKNFTMTHGACVALGCVGAAYISCRRNLLDAASYYEIRDMMVGFDLPISFDGISTQEVLDAITHDKKMIAGKCRFVLLNKIGGAFVDTSVSEAEMRDAIDSLNAECWEEKLIRLAYADAGEADEE